MVQDSEKRIFWDNDSLAALIAGETGADIVILLSDVEGLYTEPPTASGKHGELVDTYFPEAQFTIGSGSRTGVSYSAHNPLLPALTYQFALL